MTNVFDICSMPQAVTLFISVMLTPFAGESQKPKEVGRTPSWDDQFVAEFDGAVFLDVFCLYLFESTLQHVPNRYLMHSLHFQLHHSERLSWRNGNNSRPPKQLRPAAGALPNISNACISACAKACCLQPVAESFLRVRLTEAFLWFRPVIFPGNHSFCPFKTWRLPASI
jgi:hypothetical protein